MFEFMILWEFPWNFLYSDSKTRVSAFIDTAKWTSANLFFEHYKHVEKSEEKT